MPHYEKRISTPAGTTKAAPQKRYITVDSGIIHDVAIRFRDGPDDNLHCKILQGGNQIYPTNKQGDYASDGETIKFTDYYKIVPGRNRLTIKTWNTGKFSHDVIIRIEVLKPEHLNPLNSIDELIQLLRKFFERIGVR